MNQLGDVKVTKVAVEPVWNLSGVVAQFGFNEGTLHRSRFEFTGGSYPKLVTRPDMKVFLPQLGVFQYTYLDPPNECLILLPSWLFEFMTSATVLILFNPIFSITGHTLLSEIRVYQRGLEWWL